MSGCGNGQIVKRYYDSASELNTPGFCGHIKMSFANGEVKIELYQGPIFMSPNQKNKEIATKMRCRTQPNKPSLIFTIYCRSDLRVMNDEHSSADSLSYGTSQVLRLDSADQGGCLIATTPPRAGFMVGSSRAGGRGGNTWEVEDSYFHRTILINS
ncbi:hypothetical protein DL93DRAFT_2098986 [Clavulina sp. PMI_390]|nr:hypothetical protein DL93DRAFT_2098986 [Clavulina sp. PMI_390]